MNAFVEFVQWLDVDKNECKPFKKPNLYICFYCKIIFNFI